MEKKQSLPDGQLNKQNKAIKVISMFIALLIMGIIIIVYVFAFSSSLTAAIFSGNVFMVEMILKKDKSAINRYDSLNINAPIHLAAGGNNIQITKLLINNGANVNLMERDEGYYPVHIAIDNNNPEMLRLLLDSGANPNARIGNSGKTAEEYAKSKGRTELAEIIASRKAKKGGIPGKEKE
ncbi:MAG: ankyrin repeat domain-containing protein [Firmicutes bacterium]|nr:ankyrin repeat domain-containing protein [Bacillota bacterium]